MAFTGSLGNDSCFTIWDEIAYELVQIVSQEISAARSTMTIINCEKAACGPIIDFFETWLGDVQNDAHAVFIVVSIGHTHLPEYTLVGVRGIC